METTALDPTLIGDTGSMQFRIATPQISRPVGEKMTLKTIARIQEWRKAVRASEHMRLRKSILDQSAFAGCRL
jgi:hypothetical protein